MAEPGAPSDARRTSATPPPRNARGAALDAADRQPLWKRIAWLVLLWSASVLFLTLVGWLLRLWLAP